MTRGFSYVEVLVAVVVLAGAVLAAAHALGSAREHDAAEATRRGADALLQDAITRVRALARLEAAFPSFGLEAGETVPDDVDDLDGWTENGPTDVSGTTWPSDWRRVHTVDSVALADPTSVVADGSTSLLRVRIGVAYRGTEVATETLWFARTP